MPSKDDLGIPGVTTEDLSGPEIDRRTTLKLFAATGITPIAGCLGSDEDGEPDDSDDSDGGNGTDDGANSDESDGTDDTTEAAGIDRGGTLVTGWQVEEITWLDPVVVGTTDYMVLMRNILEGPLRTTADLTIGPELAHDWEVTKDPFSITFDIREGVTFHNGNDLTAQDFKYQARRSLEDEESFVRGRFSELQPLNDGGVEVIDDYTVRYNFENAFAPVLLFLTTVHGRAATVTNREAVEGMGRDQHNRTPVGTGPFEVVEHRYGEEVRLEAYDDYWREDNDGNQLPYLDKIEIPMIPEPETAVSAIRAGDIDFLHQVPLANIPEIEQSSDIHLTEQPELGYTGYNINHRQRLSA